MFPTNMRFFISTSVFWKTFGLFFMRWVEFSLFPTLFFKLYMQIVELLFLGLVLLNRKECYYTGEFALFLNNFHSFIIR